MQLLQINMILYFIIFLQLLTLLEKLSIPTFFLVEIFIFQSSTAMPQKQTYLFIGKLALTTVIDLFEEGEPLLVHK